MRQNLGISKTDRSAEVRKLSNTKLGQRILPPGECGSLLLHMAHSSCQHPHSQHHRCYKVCSHLLHLASVLDISVNQSNPFLNLLILTTSSICSDNKAAAHSLPCSKCFLSPATKPCILVIFCTGRTELLHFH